MSENASGRRLSTFDSSKLSDAAEANPRARRTRVVTIAIVLAVVLAGGLGTGIYLDLQRKPPAPAEDGPTFYQAIASVNQSVSQQPGGPWTLYAVWGVASPVPFDPNAVGWLETNRSVNSCGQQFNGLTLWNGSIPLFTGSFDSGTAPFWQFAYFSNASQSILIATDVFGAGHVYPPMSMTSTCAQASDLSDVPWVWARLVSPFPSNSPIMARSAWNAIGEKWLAANQPAYEAYIFGWSYWASAEPQGLEVKFARCGEVGATGVQPVVYVAMNGAGKWTSYFNGTQGCGDVVSIGPPPVYGGYRINFSAPLMDLDGNSLRVNQSFLNSYEATNDTDAGGLVSWMTTLNLSTGTGQRLPSVLPACANWVPSITACSSGGPGWYAVLLSSSGEWLDSYPSTVNGTAWELPNVSLVSDQYLVVVEPSGWDLTSDTLSVHTTVPVIQITGSTVL